MHDVINARLNYPRKSCVIGLCLEGFIGVCILYRIHANLFYIEFGQNVSALSGCLSPVSPVFCTEVTVSVGLKTCFRVGTFIP